MEIVTNIATYQKKTPDNETVKTRRDVMTFTSIASGSSGNAYLVEADGVAPLLLEAGLPIKLLREKLSFRLTGLAGCLVSHEHGDHAKAVKDLLKSGVDCWMSRGTAETLGVQEHHRVARLKGYHGDDLSTWYFPRTIGPWKIQPFALDHDAAEPTGFLVGHGDDRLLFIPDTSYVQNRFADVTIAAIECNHISDILMDNVLDGHLPAVVGRRIRRNHMSLENLIAMLKSNDLSKCRAIYLIHLSSGNSNEELMKLEIQKLTGIPTYIAQE